MSEPRRYVQGTPIRTGDDIEIRGAGFVPVGAQGADRLSRMVVRVGAEDPAADFRPQTGRIVVMCPPADRAARVLGVVDVHVVVARVGKDLRDGLVTDELARLPLGQAVGRVAVGALGHSISVGTPAWKTASQGRRSIMSITASHMGVRPVRVASLPTALGLEVLTSARLVALASFEACALLLAFLLYRWAGTRAAVVAMALGAFAGAEWLERRAPAGGAA